MALRYGKSFLGFSTILVSELFIIFSVLLCCDCKGNVFVDENKELTFSVKHPLHFLKSKHTILNYRLSHDFAIYLKSYLINQSHTRDLPLSVAYNSSAWQDFNNYLNDLFMKPAIDMEPYDSGANESSRYIELVLVVDNSMFRKLGSSIAAVHKRYRLVVKYINSLYQRFNIFVALVDIKIWTDGDKIKIERDFDKTVDNFRDYAKKLLKNKNVDAVHLITNIQSHDHTVGLSYLGKMCGNDFASVGINSDVLVFFNEFGLIISILAHEIAHTMGLGHDDENCSCPEEACVMAAADTVIDNNQKWSDCSVESMEDMLRKEDFTCLNNKPTNVFLNPTCGNGVVEPGEECDCGILGDKCENALCCNREICMLKANVSCAFGKCCDVKNCAVRRAGTICRAKLHDCDLPEYCDGAWEHCPDDVVKSGGEWCSDGPDCFDHKCNGTEAICSIDCNNHGVCNSKGHCHCEDNYDPPSCLTYGAGGSIDSGPAQDPEYVETKRDLEVLFRITAIICISCLGVLCLYCSKKESCFRKLFAIVIQRVTRNRRENTENVANTIQLSAT